MERLRHHFIKACHKSPFQKDSREYEELLETVNNPQQERKKSFLSHSKKCLSIILFVEVEILTDDIV